MSPAKIDPVLSSGGAQMRERLLDVALELFSRNGYGGTTVSAIVAAAGVTQPMLYYYFKNKQALFEALVEQALIAYDQLLQHDLPAGLSAREQLLELCRRGLHASGQNHVLTKLLFSLAFSHSEEVGICARVDAVIRRFLNTLEGIIRRGIAAGEFRSVDPADLAWAIYAVLFRAMESALINVPTNPGAKGMNRVIANILLPPLDKGFVAVGRSKKRPAKGCKA